MFSTRFHDFSYFKIVGNSFESTQRFFSKSCTQQGLCITSFLESWAGVEPAHVGFANRSVNHFATRTDQVLLYHSYIATPNYAFMLSSFHCRGGGVGRHEGLKLPCHLYWRAGSNPALGTETNRRTCSAVCFGLQSVEMTHLQ